MDAFAAYFDASGSPSTPVLAVGGLVATPEKWLDFDNRWSECLNHYGVSALHMKEFAHCVNEFENWELDEPRRRRFLKWLIEIMEETVEYTAAAAIHLPDYRIVNERYQLEENRKPYTIACLACVAAMLQGCRKAKRTPPCVWVFERGDADQDNLRKNWNKEYPESSNDPIFKSKIDNYPDPSARKPIRAFEAADLIAYENLQANKQLQGNEGWAYLDDLRWPMQRMRSLPGCEDWLLFEAPQLESACKHFKIPVRKSLPQIAGVPD